MSDDIDALAQAATDARAHADDLTAALTDTSSPEEQEAAKAPEQAAVDATQALADAQNAAAVSGGGVGSADEQKPKAGDTCTCPDGRTGTVHSYDEGLICIPNADQG